MPVSPYTGGSSSYTEMVNISERPHHFTQAFKVAMLDETMFQQRHE